LSLNTTIHIINFTLPSEHLRTWATWGGKIVRRKFKSQKKDTKNIKGQRRCQRQSQKSETKKIAHTRHTNSVSWREKGNK